MVYVVCFACGGPLAAQGGRMQGGFHVTQSRAARQLPRERALRHPWPARRGSLQAYKSYMESYTSVLRSVCVDVAI